MKTRVGAVCVIEESFVNAERMNRLVARTVAVLRKAGSSIPDATAPRDDFRIRSEYFGGVCGCYTGEGQQAARILQDELDIPLEVAYTAKALAASLRDGDDGRIADNTVLFWDTYNLKTPDIAWESVDYRQLPKAFHRYFDDDVQPLDRDRAPTPEVDGTRRL